MRVKSKEVSKFEQNPSSIERDTPLSIEGLLIASLFCRITIFSLSVILQNDDGDSAESHIP